jgi:mono/diheme cytochrome c family protein
MRGGLMVAVACLSYFTVVSWAGAQSGGDPVERGRYLIRAAGCIGCHTDVKAKGPELAGGRAFKTPYGTFYSPNITPDRETGIGAWSAVDFDNAVRQGLRPDGSHLYPVFPYPTYSRMKPDDVAAIRAYLFSREPVAQANKPHDLTFPFSWRFTLTFWKWLYFDPKTFEPDPSQSDQWNRGAYLTRALAHCDQCHTPRTALGGLDTDMDMAGTVDGPDGELVPNITPDGDTGIGRWTEGDLVSLMKTGLKPDFDDVQGAMYEAIEFGLKHLTDDDLRAIAVYIRSLPPISHKVERRR